MGYYFIGQTPILDGQSGNALAALCNPCNSDRILYVNAITITNISDENLAAEFYLGPCLSNGTRSSLVSSTNTDICPKTSPVGTIESYPSPVKAPTNGVPIFSRIVLPQSTLVVDGGQIILGRMQSLLVYIGGFEPIAFQGIRFAFGWSEEQQYCC